ncbi:hypothetical protein COU37_00355 [Candidatus Micrarchaeota archaeon CG10_big_fil_rev_8_21_14_0_10_45_29]|nr:MAG: hypothetical protein COU37_00355 [Candidatus Micrarchaeota archaeon CG10_big_fil_rev_8_21_14_0_10_45_29]
MQVYYIKLPYPYMPEPLDTLQQRWDATCKILLGEPIGALQDYREWLLELTEPLHHTASSISGKKTTYYVTKYEKNSKRISFEEIDFAKNYPAPNMDAKNIQELLNSISGRFHYAGNIILGKCGAIEKSSNLQNSFYMLESGNYDGCKYTAYSTVGRFSEDSYGGNGIGNSSIVLKCKETFENKRCLEAWMSQYVSDCYYSYALANCSDCMFCFHLKGKKHCIGNLQLTPEQYKQIKKKLLSQMLSYLKEHKRLPSLAEIARNSKLDKSIIEKIKLPESKKEKKDLQEIESAFKKACKLIFGKELPGKIDDYGKWLSTNKREIKSYKSAISGKPVFIGDYCALFDLPKDRLLGADEAPAFAQAAHLSLEEVQSLEFSKITQILGKIAYFSPEYYEGASANIIDTPTAMDSSNCYKTFATVWAKYCAYGFWPRSSEYIFGFDTCLSSSFCINCYNSTSLTRCFEMDGCANCSDSYFCHNSESLSNCLFCFNVKAKHYAIGNVEVGKEKYEKIKKMVLEEIAKKLEKEKKLELNIYNIGSLKK